MASPSRHFSGPRNHFHECYSKLQKIFQDVRRCNTLYQPVPRTTSKDTTYTDGHIAELHDKVDPHQTCSSYYIDDSTSQPTLDMSHSMTPIPAALPTSEIVHQVSNVSAVPAESGYAGATSFSDELFGDIEMDLPHQTSDLGQGSKSRKNSYTKRFYLFCSQFTEFS